MARVPGAGTWLVPGCVIWLPARLRRPARILGRCYAVRLPAGQTEALVLPQRNFHGSAPLCSRTVRVAGRPDSRSRFALIYQNV